MTDFELYFSQIYDGRITACQKMKRVSEMLLNNMAKPGKYHFDPDIANEPIIFIEKFCKVPSGRLGQPLKLELFQKARIQAIFGFVDDDLFRQYWEVLTVEGRKNGKTTESSGINLYMFAGDGEGSPQNYNVATKHDQAMLGFRACEKMIKQSTELQKNIHKITSGYYCEYNFGIMQALAADSKSLDGLDVHFANIDELEAIKRRDLYDVIKQGTGARKQPLIYCISTNGFVRNCIFDSQYEYSCGVLDGSITDERFLPFIYELDSIDEWIDEDCWVKANPGLGTIKSWDYLRSMVNKALSDPDFKPTVLVKDFNVKQNDSGAYLTEEEIKNDKISEEKFNYCIGAFDAADKIDLNAALAVCRKPGKDETVVRAMFWLPENQVVRSDETKERDFVPYRKWAAEGLLRLHPGNKVEKQVILDWYLELRDQEGLMPYFIGYDPWHISDELLAKFKAEFGSDTMIPVRQGAFTLSEPMKEMKADFHEHKIVYQNNPILNWNLRNLVAKRDINANVQPVKSDSKLKRIDGAVALIIAYKILGDKQEEFLSINEE